MTPQTQWVGGRYPISLELLKARTPEREYNTKQLKQLLPLMTNRPGLTREQICDALGINLKTLMRSLEKHTYAGRVRFEYTKRRVNPEILTEPRRKMKTWFATGM
jgi:hypothetical protein